MSNMVITESLGLFYLICIVCSALELLCFAALQTHLLMWRFTCFSLHLSLIISCNLKSSSAAQTWFISGTVKYRTAMTKRESEQKRKREQQLLSCKSPDTGGVTQPWVNTPPSSSRSHSCLCLSPVFVVCAEGTRPARDEKFHLELPIVSI